MAITSPVSRLGSILDDVRPRPRPRPCPRPRPSGELMSTNRIGCLILLGPIALLSCESMGYAQAQSCPTCGEGQLCIGGYEWNYACTQVEPPSVCACDLEGDYLCKPMDLTYQNVQSVPFTLVFRPQMDCEDQCGWCIQEEPESRLCRIAVRCLTEDFWMDCNEDDPCTFQDDISHAIYTGGWWFIPRTCCP